MRKRRLPRPLHAALCLLAMVLILALVRLYCGPPGSFTAMGQLRRAARQNLRGKGEVVRRWQDSNHFAFALWDGEEVQVYELYRELPRRSLAPYRGGRLFRDSREEGWGCLGVMMTNWDPEKRQLQPSVPVLVKNADPAAARGELTVTLQSWSELNQTYIHRYTWHASAQREDPRVFFFTLESRQKEDRTNVLHYLYLHYLYGDPAGDGERESTAEVLWYDEKGNELYRQSFALVDAGLKTEGSEKNGA